jgi:hypothetical protein
LPVSLIDILTAATIDVFADDPAISSLDQLPPGGIVISDPSGGTFTVSLVAGNAQAGLTASGADGATIAQDQNTLAVTGNLAQVNAALASLQITELFSGTDALAITVADPLAGTVGTTVAIDALPTIGPAYVAPPLEVTFAPQAPDAIHGLVLTDPFESGLAAMGFGAGITLAGAAEGTLRVILTVGNGVLLLPGFDPAGGITAAGLGTGSIALTCAANELAALNALLAGLEYVGPAGKDELEFSANDLLNGAALDGTYSRLFLRLKGTQGTAQTIVAGTQTLALAGAPLAGALSVTGELVMLSTAASAATLAVAPGASLDVTAVGLTLAGTSLDFGAVTAPALAVAGTLLAGEGISFAGPAVIGTAGYVDASGLVDFLGSETADGALALSLAAGGVFEGNGTLLLGNDGASGAIFGPGTILAGAGETLLIAGGSVGGGAQLEVAPGGVLVLGPVSPLYGIFNETPLTIDHAVTLSFEGSVGASPITGGYANSLALTGGALVISGAEVFGGTVAGFAPGDALIFPDITDLTVADVTLGRSSFAVLGTDETGSPVSFTVLAAAPLTLYPAAVFDVEDDPEVVLRPVAATIAVPEVYFATTGTAQPLQGLALEMSASTTLSLAVTLTAQHGTLSEGGSAGAALTLSAANLAALNGLLGSVDYTGTVAGNGANDTVTITSNSDDIGLQDFVPVVNVIGGTVNGYGGLAFTEAQAAAFAPHAGLYQQVQPVAAGEAVVTGTVLFGAPLQDDGLSGTSLLVDGGGDAMFGLDAPVTLLAGTTIGDGNGPGSIAILGTDFIEAGNFVVTALSPGAGSVADVLGGLTIAGSLAVGLAGQGALTLAGTLAGQAAGVGSAGTIIAQGSAALTLTTLSDGGLVVLENSTSLSLGSLAVGGRLTIGGSAAVESGGFVAVAAGGGLSLAADALLAAGSLTAGGSLQLAGLLTLAGALDVNGLVNLAGGTVVAASLLDAGTIAGDGVVAAPTILNDGDVFVKNGTLLVAGNFANAGAVDIQTGGTLDIAGTASGTPYLFTGPNALLTVDDPLDFSAGASQFAGGDEIDLVGVAPALVSYAAGVVTITESAGVAGFVLGGTTSGVVVGADGAGGTDLTINGQLPCFARGTRLLTPQGYRPVETLRPGDPVITAAGAKRPVRWLGWRTLDFRGGRWRDALPVCIEAGAFAPGVPARAVVLSPQHAVCVPGALIPVGQLVNGVTVRRLPASAATYYHVELDRHDAVLAEGLACESYFDDGNRGGLYRSLGQPHPARRPMAPYMTAGSRVILVRRRLHERVLAMGYTPTFAPRLSVVAEGVQAAVAIDAARVAHIRLPHPARRLMLMSPATAAAETDPETDDWRAVSLCWAPAAGVRFGEGFYERAAGDRGVWMGGRGEVILRKPAREVALRMAAVARSWGRV